MAVPYVSNCGTARDIAFKQPSQRLSVPNFRRVLRPSSLYIMLILSLVMLIKTHMLAPKVSSPAGLAAQVEEGNAT